MFKNGDPGKAFVSLFSLGVGVVNSGGSIFYPLVLANEILHVLTLIQLFCSVFQLDLASDPYKELKTLNLKKKEKIFECSSLFVRASLLNMKLVVIDKACKFCFYNKIDTFNWECCKCA